MRLALLVLTLLAAAPRHAKKPLITEMVTVDRLEQIVAAELNSPDKQMAKHLAEYEADRAAEQRQI